MTYPLKLLVFYFYSLILFFALSSPSFKPYPLLPAFSRCRSSGSGGRRAPAWPSGGCGGRWRLVERQRLRRAAAAGRAAVGGRAAAAVEGSGGGRQVLVWLSGGDCGGRRQAGPRATASRRLAADSFVCFFFFAFCDSIKMCNFF